MQHIFFSELTNIKKCMNLSICYIYTKIKDCLLNKSWDVLPSSARQLYVDTWKDQLIIMFSTSELKTQGGRKTYKAWWREYYTGSKPFKNFIGSFTRNNSEPRLASPLQFQFGPYSEYLTDMVTVIYNHARKVCWQAKTLTKEWSLLDKWNTYHLTFGNAT